MGVLKLEKNILDKIKNEIQILKDLEGELKIKIEKLSFKLGADPDLDCLEDCVNRELRLLDLEQTY